jgi:FG-GAP-like repeat
MKRLVWVLVWALALAILPVTSPVEAASWRFTDITGSTGLAATQETWTANAVDYNADGRQDILIGYHDNGGKLWRNNGNGTMSWVAQDAWPVRWATPTGVWKRADRHGGDWADVDLDGRIDAYYTVGRTGSNRVKDGATDNELWLQRSPGAFTDVATQLSVGDPYGRGRSAVFLDANTDGRPDLYVVNEVPRSGDVEGQASGTNKLFLNVADPASPYGFRFARAPSWGIDRHFGFGQTVLSFDYDGDGREDLLLSGRSRLFLFRNTGSNFLDVSTTCAIPGGHVQAAAAADIDHDGRTDLVEVRKTSVAWQRNLGTTFAPAHTIRALTYGSEVAVADADGDGLDDVYVQQAATSWNPPDFVFLNRRTSWISVQAPSMAGRASDVEALALRGAGRPVDFVVLNGSGNLRGPVKVLRLTLTTTP